MGWHDDWDEDSPLGRWFQAYKRCPPSFGNDGYGRLVISDLIWEVDRQLRMPWHGPYGMLHQDVLEPPDALDRLEQAFEQDPLLFSAMWGCSLLRDRISP